MKSKLAKIFNAIITVFIVCVLLISILILTVALTSKSDHTGIPNLLGKAPITVLTNSMEGNDPLDFSEGDLLICDSVDPQADNEYEVGDVVTFSFDIDGDGILDYVTHRLYEENEDGSFLTKGDNNYTYDQDPDNSPTFPDIKPDMIVATYHGTKIPGVGKVLSFLQTSLGFFLCILLPMIFFFLYVLIKVVINVIDYKRAVEEEKREKESPNTPQMSAEEYEQFKQFMEMKKAQDSKEEASKESVVSSDDTQA